MLSFLHCFLPKYSCYSLWLLLLAERHEAATGALRQQERSSRDLHTPVSVRMFSKITSKAPRAQNYPPHSQNYWRHWRCTLPSSARRRPARAAR